MKKILFVVSEFNIGGVEKALIGVLNSLPKDKYKIDIGATHARGDLMDMIPDWCDIVEIKSLNKFHWIKKNVKNAILHFFKSGQFFKGAKLLGCLLLSKLQNGSVYPIYKRYINPENDGLGEYDVAISFQGPDTLLDYYVAECVEAKNKIGWIHFDTAMYPIQPASIRKSYSKFDKIFIVSKQGKETFDRQFPELSDRTEVMLNIIDRKAILKMSEQQHLMDNSKLKIVTVGRLSHEKGQDICINAAFSLKSQGIDFIWYFVGDGDDKEVLVEMTKELGISDHIKFIPATPNPYPYMAGCDIYVQPSRHEGYCITLGEAKLFGHPIVSANFTGAGEQLNEVANSRIVPIDSPYDISEAVAEAIKFSDIPSSYEGNLPQIERLLEILN